MTFQDFNFGAACTVARRRHSLASGCFAIRSGERFAIGFGGAGAPDDSIGRSWPRIAARRLGTAQRHANLSI